MGCSRSSSCCLDISILWKRFKMYRSVLLYRELLLMDYLFFTTLVKFRLLEKILRTKVVFLLNLCVRGGPTSPLKRVRDSSDSSKSIRISEHLCQISPSSHVFTRLFQRLFRKRNSYEFSVNVLDSRNNKILAANFL